MRQKRSWHQKKNKPLSHSIEWRLTGSTIYISRAQLDGGVTGRDHKSRPEKDSICLGLWATSPGTHPLQQLSHMLHLQSAINDLISLGPRSLSVSVSETGHLSSLRGAFLFMWVDWEDACVAGQQCCWHKGNERMNNHLISWPVLCLRCWKRFSRGYSCRLDIN